MGKKIKLNIKNEQLAEALNLGGLKEKLAKRAEGKETESKAAHTKKTASKKEVKPKAENKTQTKEEVTPTPEVEGEESHPKVKARSKSAFATEAAEHSPHKKKSVDKAQKPTPRKFEKETPPTETNRPVKLGPTGKHVNDFYKSTQKKPEKIEKPQRNKEQPVIPPTKEDTHTAKETHRPKKDEALPDDDFTKEKPSKVKQFRDFKPKHQKVRTFDARDKQGLRDSEDDQRWRKRKQSKTKTQPTEDLTVRPSSLKVRIPITVKDLAAEMKLKASEVIAKLLAHGVIKTLNDTLDDETTIQLIGEELGCSITIDTSEEERIRITDKTIREEIQATDKEKLKIRPPVVAFMGHVDHGKTSLIDSIRNTNIVSGEAGAITQHIGAFRCHTNVGDITVLDTPGHEAFSAMRARGADATDIVVLVVAGDEGIKQQTIEAIQHAKAAAVTIVVAINKCDKPNFNAENVFRQLAEQELLPEAWGGQTITVNTSAQTGEGIQQLLEMLALQAEVLELKADNTCRARGTILESEMHKGLGMVANILVQNGILRQGDALVCDVHWGRVKTMYDEHGKSIKEATPSTPVEITGLSSLPEAGEEFIVVSTEKEAREIAEARLYEAKSRKLQRRRTTLESLLQDAGGVKKILNVIIRADVQGSLEALKVALNKIESDKVDLEIIGSGVGEISESDVQLAAASKAIIIGFHTQIESKAADLAREKGIQVDIKDVIYHCIDKVKEFMTGLLDKIAKETDMGVAEVKATFKSSQHGIIAGCMVNEGHINRNHKIRVIREGEVIATSSIQSLKRVKEDVREVKAGVECGILLTDFKDFKEGDLLQAYEITYIEQKL